MSFPASRQMWRRSGKTWTQNNKCLPLVSPSQVLLPPGEMRKCGGEEGQECRSTEAPAHRNPRPRTQRYPPTIEDVMSNESQALGHGKCSIHVSFSLPLPLPGKYQQFIKEIFTRADLRDQAELVDNRSYLCQPNEPSTCRMGSVSFLWLLFH